MKKAVKCISLALALLLAGCNNKGEDIDLSPDPIETEETGPSLNGLRRSDMTPFIMPSEGTEEYGYYSSLLTWGGDCVPGQLYLLCTVSSNSEAILKISDRIFRMETGLVNVRPKDRKMIYAVAITDEGDCLVKTDQETGRDTVLYSADGEILYMIASSYLSGYATLHEDDCLYFSDGRTIMRFDFFTEEITAVVENEMQFQELQIINGDLTWQNIDGSYFIYSLETGEIRQTTYEELHPFNKTYHYVLLPREDDPENSDLYLVEMETMESELILENITNFFYATTDVIIIYAQVRNEYIISVNNTDGNIETVYTAAADGMELLGCAVKQLTDPEGIPFIYVRDGDEIVMVDGETLETSKLFRLENGLSRFEHPPFAQENQAMSYFDSAPLNDPDDYYICEECGDNDLMYCIWADTDGNWFWYHPHSQVNEEIEVVQDDILGYYFIKQTD